jgi:hypothetical protein
MYPLGLARFDLPSEAITMPLGMRPSIRYSGHKTANMFRRYDIANEDDLRQAIEAVQRYHEAQAEKVVTIASGK